MNASSLKSFVLGVAISFVVLGAVGGEDYRQEKKAEAMYCKNVKSEVWPDFKNIYEKVCKDR